MHMKRALLVADDVHTRAWVRQAVGDLDLAFVETGVGALAARLTEDEYELVIVDGGRSPEGPVQSIEDAAAGGSKVRLLLLVEPEALPRLRLPIGPLTDFVVRGATSDELSARVRALLWPGEEVSAQELVRVDDLTVNLATYQAYRRGEPIDFTYLEYALFTFLVTHPNRAYSREMLLRRVWGTDYYGGSRTVDVHIRRIRAKVGPELSRRLSTVRNVGYLWRS